MPDPALSAAIAEAYASAPVDQVVYHTLEIWHPSFSVPIRVVRDTEALDARIEAGAARDAGEVVTFTAYAFDVVPPDQTAEGVPQAATQIATAGRARIFMQGGRLRVVRDGAATLPVALFSMRNIRRGSFSVSYVMASEATADAVEVTISTARPGRRAGSPRRCPARPPPSRRSCRCSASPAGNRCCARACTTPPPTATAAGWSALPPRWRASSRPSAT